MLSDVGDDTGIILTAPVGEADPQYSLFRTVKLILVSSSAPSLGSDKQREQSSVYRGNGKRNNRVF